MIRVINKELQGICSLNHDSILRDDFEAVKQFSWETVWIELTNNMPTLMAILTGLVPNACDNKPFLCFVASMLLKKGYQKWAWFSVLFHCYYMEMEQANR